jgi:hypothetical protein
VHCFGSGRKYFVLVTTLLNSYLMAPFVGNEKYSEWRLSLDDCVSGRVCDNIYFD